MGTNSEDEYVAIASAVFVSAFALDDIEEEDLICYWSLITIGMSNAQIIFQKLYAARMRPVYRC